MAFEKRVTLKGAPNIYEISPNIKKYALLDVGFQKTKNDNFTLERSLDPSSPYQGNGPKLKVMIDKDLTGFKLATTTANGLQNFDIFKKGDEGIIQQFNYQMDTLFDREILTKLD